MGAGGRAGVSKALGSQLPSRGGTQGAETQKGTPGDHQAEGQDTERQRPTGGERDDRPALLGSFQEIRIGMGHQKREPGDFPFRPV